MGTAPQNARRPHHRAFGSLNTPTEFIENYEEKRMVLPSELSKSRKWSPFEENVSFLTK